MNSLTVCGNMGQAPELSYTTSGQPVCKFSVADQLPKTKDGQEATQWFSCRAFGHDAEKIHEYFDKGHPIWVSGVLSSRLYTRSDGTAGYSLDLHVKAWNFVPFGQKRREDDPAEPTPPTPRPAAASAPTTATAEDDVPDITDPFEGQ